MKSWSTSEIFSSKVIYDIERKQYVGVFLKTFLRFWDADTVDINKNKKFKLTKPIHELVNVNVNRVRKTLVVYEDGTCESLESALQSRSEKKISRKKTSEEQQIENIQVSNGFFSFIKTVGHEKLFCFSKIDEETLRPLEKAKTAKLARPGQNVKLMGCVAIAGRAENSNPFLITIWSDNKLFKRILSVDDDNSPSIGTLHATLGTINAKKELAVTPISEDCVAIYACKDDDDGSCVILYNIKYKFVQSRIPFKVYLPNFNIWSYRRNIFLAMGEQLSVIRFRIAIDLLSTLVGSQCDLNVDILMEKEMINEDLHFEENLEFDEDQTEIKGMEFRPPFNHDFRRPLLSKAKPIVGAEEIVDTLNEIYREEIVVDVKHSQQSTEPLQDQLVSNVDEVYPGLSENFELLCSQLENCGHSEIEITDRVIPLLIKTNRTEDIGLLLKKYNHISEHMLTKVLKFILSCEGNGENISAALLPKNEEMEFDIVQTPEKKVSNANVFLNTNQDERRDVLVSVLSSSFDSQTMSKFLRREITLNEMIKLTEEICRMLTVSSLDEPYDIRGNLVEGDDFDMDSKLFEWFRLLLDSHYQQILLSHDTSLHSKLVLWIKLVDDHIQILSDMKGIRPLLLKISTKKPIKLSKICNQWYTIEELQLY